MFEAKLAVRTETKDKGIFWSFEEAVKLLLKLNEVEKAKIKHFAGNS